MREYFHTPATRELWPDFTGVPFDGCVHLCLFNCCATRIVDKIMFDGFGRA